MKICIIELTIIAKKISIIPRAKASSRLPFDVSKAIVVVITRVDPAILPPTIITAPTSAIARPNPAQIAVKIENLASMINILKRNNLDALTLFSKRL